MNNTTITSIGTGTKRQRPKVMVRGIKRCAPLTTINVQFPFIFYLLLTPTWSPNSTIITN